MSETTTKEILDDCLMNLQNVIDAGTRQLKRSGFDVNESLIKYVRKLSVNR